MYIISKCLQYDEEQRAAIFEIDDEPYISKQNWNDLMLSSDVSTMGSQFSGISTLGSP